MFDTLVFKEVLVIHFIIQSNDSGNIMLLENLNILVRMVSKPLMRLFLLNRTHKSHELLWDDPVEVSVLDSFIELVLLYVKSSEVVPSEFDCVF